MLLWVATVPFNARLKIVSREHFPANAASVSEVGGRIAARQAFKYSEPAVHVCSVPYAAVSISIAARLRARSSGRLASRPPALRVFGALKPIFHFKRAGEQHLAARISILRAFIHH